MLCSKSQAAARAAGLANKTNEAVFIFFFLFFIFLHVRMEKEPFAASQADASC